MNILAEPSKYNYLDALYGCQDQSLIPALELFSLGTYADYVRYKDQYTFELTEELALKLIKTTVLSIVQENAGRTLTKQCILGQYGLDAGINNSKHTKHDDYIDTILIEMVDEGAIEVKIDDETDSVIIVKAKSLRDAYDSRMWKLVVLHEEDVSSRSLALARSNLGKWYEDKFTGVSEPNTRKRKIPAT